MRFSTWKAASGLTTVWWVLPMTDVGNRGGGQQFLPCVAHIVHCVCAHTGPVDTTL